MEIHIHTHTHAHAHTHIYIYYIQIYLIAQPHDSKQKRIIFCAWSLVIKLKIDFPSY